MSEVEPEIRGAPEEPLHGSAGAVNGGGRDEHNYGGNSEGTRSGLVLSNGKKRKGTLEGYQLLRG